MEEQEKALVKSEVEDFADFSIIRYAQVWEDADILLEALDIQEDDVALVKVCKAQSAHREALTIHLAHFVGEVGHTGDLVTILIEQLRLHGERQAEQQEHSYRFLHHSHFMFLWALYHRYRCKDSDRR